MMPLKRVVIEDFRAIEHLEFELDPRLSVLFGENAGGKTTVLEALCVGLSHAWSGIGVSVQDNDLRRWRTEAGIQVAPGLWVAVECAGGTLFKSHGEHEEQAKVWQAELASSSWAVGAKKDDPAVYYPSERSARGQSYHTIGTRYPGFFAWFADLEDKERREKLAKRDFDHTLPVLDAIREALARTLPGVSNPRTETDPLRWMVDLDVDGTPTPMELTELSDGYRTHLALVMDLAGRMVQANPHLGLDSPAVVLIDEVDLHLHPKWQQRVLPDLLRAFPKAQFIVTTHSEQVLSSVPAHQIYRLERGPDGLTATHPEFSLGAESGRVSRHAMGVEPRVRNKLSAKLERYGELVREGQGRGERAMALRRELDASELAQDPELVRLDMEMRRQERNERLGRA